MLHDVRQQKLASNLVNCSCQVKKGDRVWIDARGCDWQLVALLVKEIYKNGAEKAPFFAYCSCFSSLAISRRTISSSSPLICHWFLIRSASSLLAANAPGISPRISHNCAIACSGSSIGGSIWTSSALWYTGLQSCFDGFPQVSDPIDGRAFGNF